MEVSSNLYWEAQEITIGLCLVGQLRWSAGQRVTTEEGMATHSSFLAWRIPWTEEPGGLQPMGSQRVGHDWADTAVSLTGWDASAESPERSTHCQNQQCWQWQSSIYKKQAQKWPYEKSLKDYITSTKGENK